MSNVYLQHLIKNNRIKVLIKSIKYNYNMFSLDVYDYITDIPYIILNQNNTYIFEGNDSNSNSLCVINENKFAILLNVFNGLPENNYENSLVVFYIFNIFNNNKNINVRKYSINFKLYKNYITWSIKEIFWDIPLVISSGL